MMAAEASNAGVKRILPHTGCWFRVGGVPVEPTAGQAKNTESYGPTPEHVSHGKRISNWLLKRGATNEDQRKGGRPMQAAYRPKPNVISRIALAALFYSFRFAGSRAD